MKVCILLIFGVANVLAFTQQQPILGDVRIKNYSCHTVDSKKRVSGEAQVFLTDGLFPPTWSSICATDFFNNETKTFCQQLGYKSGVLSNPIDQGADPVFITNVSCEQDYSHLFRCNYDIKSNSTPCQTELGQNKIVTVECETEIVQSQEAYQGQITLCPPDNKDDDDKQSCRSQSVSTGIVSIWFDQSWGALAYTSNGNTLTNVITHYRGNLICQQMGFQQVVSGSIQTLSSYKLANYSFESCLNSDHSESGLYLVHAWVTTNELYCVAQDYKDVSCTSTLDDPCFSCCYDYPKKKEGQSLPPENYIVLQCIYDAYNENPVPFGNEEKCHYEKDSYGQRIVNYNSYCAGGSHGSHSIEYNKYFKALISSIVLGILFLAALTVIIVTIICCLICRYCKGNGYRRLDLSLNCFNKPNGQPNGQN